MSKQEPQSPWQAWSCEVAKRLRQQHEQIECLEKQVAAMQEQLNQLNAKPTYNIESIAYHFDQLKVEKLDGTLNIGMTAPGSDNPCYPGNIEQLAIGKQQQVQKPVFKQAVQQQQSSGQSAAVPDFNSAAAAYPSAASGITPPDHMFTDIFARMSDYLNSEAMQTINDCEASLGLQLDPHHKNNVIEDIRRQLPGRIHYYMQQLQQSDNKDVLAFPDLITDQVIAKTKRDAASALQTYMQQLCASNKNIGGKMHD